MHSDVLITTQTKEIIKIIMNVLKTYETYNLEECVRALSFLCKNEELIKYIIEADAGSIVIEKMSINEFLHTAFLFFAELTSTNSEDGIEYLFTKNILDIFYTYIETTDKSILRLILTSIANIASIQKYNSILAYHNVLIVGINKICDVSQEIRLEAGYVLKNFFTFGSYKSKIRLLGLDIFSLIAQALCFDQPEFVKVCLAGFYCMLTTVEPNEKNQCLYHFQQSGCFSALKSLALHSDPEICEFVDLICQCFIETDGSDY